MTVGDGTSWKDLWREVVAQGQCSGCGGCIVACPFGKLTYSDFEPRQSAGEAKDECDRGNGACGVCARACPRFRDAAADADRYTHGRARTGDEPFGVVRKIVIGRALDPAVRAVGQDGGVVSALLVWGLRTGRIDAALTAARDGERPLEGQPTIATDEAGVLAAAGSRYTYCPTPLILPEAVGRGLKQIAVVGTGCQASLPAVMGAHHLARWRNRVAWTFGLLCSKTFTYDGLVEGRIAAEFGMDPDRVGRIDIKGRIIVEGPEGDTRTIPLREAAAWTRPGCLACPDFAAEHADLSFGGLGQSDRWTLVLVRTALGQQVWEDAIGAGAVEQRAVEPSTISLLETMARAQRERRPAQAPSPPVALDEQAPLSAHE
jgi:coenzyme F420 hydrogenase subunit beta